MPPCDKRSALAPWLVAAALALFTVHSFAADRSELVYVGSGHKDIYAFWLDAASGALEPIGEVAPVSDASFLALSANRRFLYAITEGQKKDTSFVSSFRINGKTGGLDLLNVQLSGGSGPCHVAVDPQDEDVLVANYGSGSVSVFPMNGLGGLGPMSAFVQDHGSSVNPQRQEGPHAHCIVTDADDRFAFVCDLGLDKVMVFKFDPASGSLAPNDPPFAALPPGAGPRHIAFHPNRRFAYVISELACTVTVFAYDSGKGVLDKIETQSLLPGDFSGPSYAAEVAVHPSGKFVYASNRGEDVIGVYRCDPETGRLTLVERVATEGRTPRNFALDPTGAFLLAANQDSGTVVVFRIDHKTGRLRPTGNSAAVDLPMCVNCLIVDKLRKPVVPPVTLLPATPAVPTNPLAPPPPDIPSSPAVPATPPTPANPATPASPGTPATPATPPAPGTPATPPTPANPATPATPGTPATPSVRATPPPRGTGGAFAVRRDPS